MDDQTFQELLIVIMCHDFPDADPCERLIEYANEQAVERGYDGWIEAYHALSWAR